MSFCFQCGDEHCLIHCVWCLADCSIEETEHAPHCPQATGRYPLPDPRKPHGHPDPVCTRCSGRMGDSYYLVEIEERVFEVVCFTCKVAAEMLA